MDSFNGCQCGNFHGEPGRQYRDNRTATILAHLHASIVHGIWIITGYTLMMVILFVLLGRLGDLYGRVRLFNLGFVIFTLGSLLCAISRNGDQLVIFRFFKGQGSITDGQ